MRKIEFTSMKISIFFSAVFLNSKNTPGVRAILDQTTITNVQLILIS